MEISGKTAQWTGSLLKCCLGTCIFWSLLTGATAESEPNGSKHHEERYPLVVFDFERVELPFVICVWVLIASLAKIGFHLHSKLPTVVPESCLLIVLGLIVGCILHYSRVATTTEYVLNAEVFFIYLLPPIIFDAGYFMPIRSFFDNIGSVLLLAVVNTLMNTMFIGFSLFAVSYWGWIGRSISLLHCLIFSALISAVDPVAVISVFDEVHVNQMLYILVFGESLLNDGVTVVLYHMMEGFIELGDDNIKPVDIASGLGSFFIIALGGTLIGILYGLFGGFITKYTDHVKVIEPLFVFILGYLMYLTSEMMHLSGILALSFGGIVLRHYIEHNVTKKTSITIKYFMKMLANISETIIFMFLGLSTIVDTLDWNLAFIFFALFFTLVYRVIGVTILAWCLNLRRTVKLTKIDQFIMAFGGLRGGIAFCLALSLDEKLVPEKRLFVTATIIIVFFTVFVQGISIKPVVNALKVKKEDEETIPSLSQKINETMIDHLMAGIEEVASRSSHNLMRTKFRRFNHNYIQPILSKESAKPKATKIVNVFHEISEQDALKTSTVVMPTIAGSSADLYEDHKRALIQSSPFYQLRMDTDNDSVTLQQALRAGKSRNKWQMNRRHTIADSVESVDRVVYRKNNRRISEQPQHRQQPTLVTNGGGQVAKKRGSESGSESLSSNSEFEGVTINFNTSTKDTATIDSSPMPTTNNDASPLADDIINSSCLPWEDNNCNLPWQDSNSNLPWEDNLDPSPTHLADSIPNNEPALAHVPSWVNNLSYSHITETGSPYVSPQTTIIPPASDYHKSVYSLFPEIQDSTSNDHNHQTEESPVINQCSVNSSDYFPTPWGQSVSEDCPQVSPMAMESAIRSDDLLHSTHNEQAPDHHHVIIPTNHLLHIDSSNSSGKHPAHLTEVASAPDFQHWKPISKGMRMDEHVHLQHLQSDSMLTEMAFQEGVKSRVQEWLKQADDDEENDADDDDDTDDDDDDEADCGAIKFDCDPDGLSSARDLQLEFDHAMTLENEKDTL